MQVLRILFGWPFAFAWLCVTHFRNFLYDKGVFGSVSFPLPVICVGNLAIGGSGKTPMVNYLTGFYLSKGKKVGILSRGYGRATKGLLFADHRSTAATVGDEPLLYFRRWEGRAVIAVGEKRVQAIEGMRRRFPELEIILLDDGYQHRALRPSASLLLTAWQRPFYEDWLLPCGTLREGRRGAARAEAVVVTKCPELLTDDEINRMKGKIGAYFTNQKPIFFSYIRYGEPVSFGKAEASWLPRVLLLTGIAHAAPLIAYLSGRHIEVVRHWEKADHFVYKAKDMEWIESEYKKVGNCVVLTTEKDFVKLSEPALEERVSRIPFFYLPVEFSFSKEKQNFEAQLMNLMAKPGKGQV